MARLSFNSSVSIRSPASPVCPNERALNGFIISPRLCVVRGFGSAASALPLPVPLCSKAALLAVCAPPAACKTPLLSTSGRMNGPLGALIRSAPSRGGGNKISKRALFNSSSLPLRAAIWRARCFDLLEIYFPPLPQLANWKRTERERRTLVASAQCQFHFCAAPRAEAPIARSAGG